MILGVSTVADRGFLTLAILSLSGGVIHVSWRGFWISFKFSVLVTPIPSSGDTSVRGSGETCRFIPRFSPSCTPFGEVWSVDIGFLLSCKDRDSSNCRCCEDVRREVDIHIQR